MTHLRRPATEATEISTETTGRRDVAVPAHPDNGDVSVRDFVVAGGLRGLSVKEMFA